MTTADTLQAEARERPRMAIVAIVAALLTLAGSLLGRIIVAGSMPDNLPAALLFYNRHQASQYVSAICSALGAIAVALLLDFLFRATRARNPELSPQLRWLPWAGGVGVAVFTVALQIALAIGERHFATHGSQTYEEARKTIETGPFTLIGLLVQLAFAVAIVLISVQAMRVGLLTRFLGYLGAISGVLFVFAFVPIPIVQVYWLGALAVLFLGRMPSGTPPAWQSGEAVPWPTAAEQREARVREAEARRGGKGTANESDVVEGTASEPEDELPGLAPTKRKRKRR